MAVKLQLLIGSHPVEMTIDADGVDFTHATAGRFLEINDGGGHLELRKPGSLTANAGLELDENRRAVFHDA